MAMTELERRLFERAVTTIACALAHDEATQSGASPDELAGLRSQWVDDAEEVVDKAQRLGLWGDFDE